MKNYLYILLLCCPTLVAQIKASDFGIKNDGSLVDTTKFAAALRYCDARNDTLILDGNYMLPHDFSIKVRNLRIKGGKISTNKSIKNLKELRFDSILPTKKGIYHVAYGDFKTGGGYGNSNLYNTKVKVQIGALVHYDGYTWKRFNPIGGIKFTGDLYIEDVEFNNVAWIGLFDFVGLKTNRTITIKNSNFVDVRRVFIPDRIISPHSWAVSLSNRTVQNMVDYNFKSIEINNNYFKRIKEGILWGSPTFKELRFSFNKVEESHHIAAILNLLPSTRIIASREFYLNNSKAVVSNNEILNTHSKNEKFSSMPRSLFRLMGNSIFSDNKIINFSGIPIALGGGGSIIAYNTFMGNIDTPTKKHQNAIILFKLSGERIDNANFVFNNVVKRTNSFFIHWSYPQDFYVFNNYFQNFDYVEETNLFADKNTSYLHNGIVKFYHSGRKKWIPKKGNNTTDDVYSFEQGTKKKYILNMRLNSFDNTFKAVSLLRFIGGKKDQNLRIKSNDNLKVKSISSNKHEAKEVIIKNKKYKHRITE